LRHACARTGGHAQRFPRERARAHSVMDQIGADRVAYNQDFTHKVIIIDQSINRPLQVCLLISIFLPDIWQNLNVRCFVIFISCDAETYLSRCS